MTVEVSKLISAPVEKVYRAWTEPEQMNKWFGCNRVSGVQVRQDFRIGGEFRIEAIGCADNKPKVVFGTFKKIVPNEILVFSWSNTSEEFPAKDTLVTVEFTRKGDSTLVTVKHTNFVLAETAQAHNMGWTESLDKLAEIVA